MRKCGDFNDSCGPRRKDENLLRVIAYNLLAALVVDGPSRVAVGMERKPVNGTDRKVDRHIIENHLPF